MNRKIPFEKNELQIIGSIPGFLGGPAAPIRNAAVSPRENMAALFHEKAPFWLPTRHESRIFIPTLYNELLGRGGPDGTTDAFGIEWEWVEVAGGSMVRPGEPFLADANEWKEKVVFPDIEKWDWAKDAAENPIDPRVSTQMGLINGFWFERLVSFMDFGPAAIALIDDEQKKAVHAFFEAMTDFAIRVIDVLCKYWPGVDGFDLHDDWAGQKAPFFSEEIARELFVPYMRELTNHIHAKGRYVTLHSCGHGESRVQCFIDGGFDGWEPQAMNDVTKLYDAFGDKIVIFAIPEAYDVKTTSEDEQKRFARAYVDRFSEPGKPTVFGYYGFAALTDAFGDELFEYSRKKYLSAQ
jgi:hypothetical protein